MARSGGSGSIGLRLALAFIAVALLAVALLAGLTAAFAAADVSNLASQQRQELTQAMTAVAGAAWEEPGGWSKDDLGQVIAAGHSMGAEVQVTENTGRIVAASPGFSRGTLPVETAAVMVQGHRVGRIAVRLTGSGLPAADSVLRSALLRAIASAAGLAALFALLTGLLAARRITRPVSRLIEVTQAMGHGDRAVRVGEIHAPDELRDLAHELRTPVAVLQAGHEACSTGSSTLPPSSCRHCGMRSFAWLGWWTTCTPWPPRKRPHSSCRSTLATWPRSPALRPAAWRAGSRTLTSRLSGG